MLRNTRQEQEKKTLSIRLIFLLQKWYTTRLRWCVKEQKEKLFLEKVQGPWQYCF